MDLETENRLAALLMEEARRLRVQADKEGVHVYLQQPNVRGRPNSRFLTATVLGVQQANRAVEVGEMWRAREKELELEAKLKSRAEDKNICRGQKHHGESLRVGCSLMRGEVCRDSGMNSSSSKHAHEDCYSDDDDGLRDEEVEQFLHSRAKRGRGAVGSRMDEPGPYISSTSSGQQLMTSPDARMKEEWECRILGPEKPSFLKSHEPPEDAHDQPPEVAHDPKVRFTESSKRKHRSKERSERENPVKTKGKERSSSKHRHKRRRRD